MVNKTLEEGVESVLNKYVVEGYGEDEDRVIPDEWKSNGKGKAGEYAHYPSLKKDILKLFRKELRAIEEKLPKGTTPHRKGLKDEHFYKDMDAWEVKIWYAMGYNNCLKKVREIFKTHI